jgi:hypothetical protein
VGGRGTTYVLPPNIGGNNVFYVALDKIAIAYKHFSPYIIRFQKLKPPY